MKNYTQKRNWYNGQLAQGKPKRRKYDIFTLYQEDLTYNRLERLANVEPSKEWWEKFAERDKKRYERFASVRDTGESIRGTRLS